MITTAVQVLAPPGRSLPVFAKWVAEACEPGSTVLNIGAGVNRSGPLLPLMRKSPYLVGVDPDEAIHSNQTLQERHRTSLQAFAPGHADEYDVTLAVYVLEHIEDPFGFTTACHRVLKPGGSFFALTLNVWQYFGALTRTLSRFRLSDPVLGMLKGNGELHSHHFPPEYRLNSIRTISRHLEAAGFRSVEFRCFEATERYQWYLPGALRWFPPAYSRLAYRIGSPNMMGHLSLRAVK